MCAMSIIQLPFQSPSGYLLNAERKRDLTAINILEFVCTLCEFA